MRDTDAFIRDLNDALAGASTPQEEVQALFGAIAADVNRAADKDRQARQADAQIVDADPAAFPMSPDPTIVRVLRHTVALTGFAAGELDDIFDLPAGTIQTLMRGDDADALNLHRNFSDFVTFSRRVAATYPGRPVRDWWQTKGHGKRLTPLDLARSGRLRDRVFAPYAAELHCNGQVVSQLLPTLGRSHWVEMALTFR